MLPISFFFQFLPSASGGLASWQAALDPGFCPGGHGLPKSEFSQGAELIESPGPAPEPPKVTC